jgi:hypothetical protein
VAQQRGRDAVAARCRVGAHALEFVVRRREVLQRDRADQRGIEAGHPHPDAGRAQTGQVERVLALGWGGRRHVIQVGLEEIAQVGTVEISRIDEDGHVPSESAQLTAFTRAGTNVEMSPTVPQPDAMS